MKILTKTQLEAKFYELQNEFTSVQDSILENGGDYRSTAKQFPSEFAKLEELQNTMNRIRKCMNR